MEVKTKIVGIRVTPAEYASLMGKSKMLNLSVTEFIRMLISHGSIIKILEKDIANKQVLLNNLKIE